MSDITPEKVAAAVCEGDFGWIESMQAALSVTATGNILSLDVARWDGLQDSEVVRCCRAVVVEGETVPIVLDRPDLADALEFEGDPYDGDPDKDGWQVCAADSHGRSNLVAFADSILFRGSGHISLGEARRFAAALVAMTDAVEAAQTQTGGAQ